MPTVQPVSGTRSFLEQSPPTGRHCGARLRRLATKAIKVEKAHEGCQAPYS